MAHLAMEELDFFPVEVNFEGFQISPWMGRIFVVGLLINGAFLKIPGRPRSKNCQNRPHNVQNICVETNLSVLHSEIKI